MSNQGQENKDKKGDNNKNNNNKEVRRLYRCLRCNKKVGQKHRVKGHLWKMHVALEDVPHYCELCLYRTEKRKDLEKHPRHFSPHKVQKIQKVKAGEYFGDPAYYRSSEHPRTLTEGEDYEMLSREETLKVMKKPRGRATRRKITKDNKKKSQKSETATVTETVTTVEVVVEEDQPANDKENVQPPQSPPENEPEDPMAPVLSSPMKRIIEQEQKVQEECEDLEERLYRRNVIAVSEMARRNEPDEFVMDASEYEAEVTPAVPTTSATQEPNPQVVAAMNNMASSLEKLTNTVTSMQGTIDSLEKEVYIARTQVTGLREVVRTQGETIKELTEEKKERARPRYRSRSSSRRRRSRTPQPRKYRDFDRK